MGSTARSLVVALRVDSTGVAPGFAELTQQSAAATAQLKKDAESVAAARATLRDIQSQKPSGNDTAATQAWQEQIAAQKAIVAGEIQARNEHIQTAKVQQQIDRASMDFHSKLTRQMADEDRQYRQQQMTGLRESIKARFDAESQVAEWHQQFLDEQARQDKQFHQQEMMQLKQGIIGRLGPEDTGPGGGGPGGGGGQPGWMMRMAGMDITKNVADILAPGSGGPLGMAGYFAAGGGAMMAGIGVTMAAAGVLAMAIGKAREEAIQLEKDQRAWNDQLEISARRWDEIGGAMIRTTGPGREATQRASQSFAEEKQLREKQIDTYRSVAEFKDFAATEAWIVGGAGSIWAGNRWLGSSAANVARAQTKSDQSPWGQQYDLQTRQADLARFSTHIDDKTAADQRRIYLERSAQDNALLGGRDQRHIDLAARGLGLAGLPGGFARQQQENQIAAAQAEMTRAQDTAEKMLKVHRDYQDAVGKNGDWMHGEGVLGNEWTHDQATASSMGKGGNEQLEVWRRQLQARADDLAQQKQFDSDRVAEEDRTQRQINQIDAAAREARRNLDQQVFDRQQTSQLQMARIAGGSDPFQIRLDQQRVINNEKWEELRLAHATDAELRNQFDIGQQIMTNLQRETDYEQNMLGISRQQLQVEKERSQIDLARMRDHLQLDESQSKWSDYQRILESKGMHQAAREADVEKDHNQAIFEHNEALRAWQQAAEAQKSADIAKSQLDTTRRMYPGDQQKILEAQRQLQEAQYKADVARMDSGAADQRDREADQKWQIDKNVLQNEHALSVQNEMQGILDATAVAQGRITQLQADRNRFEREHPGERSKAELDALDAAKRGQLNADFERTMREKEITLAEHNHMISPYQADLERLHLEHPDVKDADLRKMAMLDQMDKHGDMSTRYTMGQTDFAALGSHWSFGGAGHMGPSNQRPGLGGWDAAMGVFDNQRAADMGVFDNARAGAMGAFRSLGHDHHAMHGMQHDASNPLDKITEVIKRVENVLLRIEKHGMN